MRGSNLLVVVAAVGCGRVGFDPSSGVRPDDAPLDDAALLRKPCGAKPTAPDPVTISGTTFEFSSFTNDRRELSDTMVEVLDAAGAVVGSARSNIDGEYSLSIATGGAAKELSIRYTRPGYFASRFYLDAPLDRDLVIGDPMVLNPTDGPIWNLTAMDMVYATVNRPIDGGAGTLNVRFLDCADAPILGARLTLSPQPEIGSFLDGMTGMPDRPATASETPLAFFIGFNAPAGTTTLSTTAPGLEFAPQTIEVAAGNEVTLVIVRPLEPLP